jgi:hypothetical protein
MPGNILMEIYISVGEWINSLQSHMQSASDEDCFCLPTHMHLHAYDLIKEDKFADRKFTAKVTPQD